MRKSTKVSPALPREISDGYVFAAIIQSDDAVRMIQQEMQQLYPEMKLRPEQIRTILRNTVIQDTLLDGADMLVAKAQVANISKVPVPATHSGSKARNSGAHQPML